MEHRVEIEIVVRVRDKDTGKIVGAAATVKEATDYMDTAGFGSSIMGPVERAMMAERIGSVATDFAAVYFRPRG